MIGCFFFRCLIAKDQLEPLVKIGFGFEALSDEFGFESDRRENFSVGMEGDGCAASSYLTNLFEWRCTFTTYKSLVPTQPRRV